MEINLGYHWDHKKVVDYPDVKNIGGCVHMSRKKLGKKNERAWFKPIIDRYDAWRDLVDMKSAVSIEIERCISPAGINHKMTGLPRADAVVWHSDKECSIIEAKIVQDINGMCGGLGQLLYYKTAIETYWNVKVDALLLTAPSIPPLMLDTIANCTAPVRFLKCDDANQLSGLVPRYSL